MLVKKGNRILNIFEQEKASYLNDGYDEVELKNHKYEVVTSATGGRSYSIAEYNALKNENDALKQGVKELNENDALKQEVKELAEENISLKKEIKKLTAKKGQDKENDKEDGK